MADNIRKPKSDNTVFLDQPPSCLEFCPELPGHFVVGTYLLSETKNEGGEIQQAKTGSLQLWELDSRTHALLTSSLRPFSALVQRLDLPYAVFDLHFHPSEKDKLAIASSTGAVALFTVSHAQNPPSITPIWTKQVHEDPSIPALFLAWAPEAWLPRSASDGFAVTFSDSRTAVFATNGNLADESGLAEWGSFAARQMIEVWFVALSTAIQSSENGRQEKVPFMFTGNDFGSLHTRRFGEAGVELGPEELPR
ncbi:hypothetical protein N7470_005372 [Penicillium chermesinum]|nr:hypothetical protein N7470_005372 [Penicillium chermesinum]